MWRRLANWKPAANLAKRRPTTRLLVEGLESRLAPALFTVTTTADSGAGSLRQAILDAAGNGVADTINFNSGLAGQSIVLTSNDAISAFGPTALVINNDNI